MEGSELVRTMFNDCKTTVVGLMMKIIFLDVDGVLNQLQKYHVDGNCIKELSKIYSADTRIVLTSSWRLGFSRNINQCSPQIRKLITCLNKYNMSIMYCTEKLGDRRKEVLSWLQGKNIESYIILDDDKSEYSSIDRLNIYLTNSKTGLTSKDIKSIKKMF